MALTLAFAMACGGGGLSSQTEDQAEPDAIVVEDTAPEQGGSLRPEGISTQEAPGDLVSAGENEAGESVPVDFGPLKRTLSLSVQPGRARVVMIHRDKEASGPLEIHLVKDQGDEVFLTLIDPSGRKVASKRWPAQAEEEEISLGVTEGGRYLLEVMARREVVVTLDANAQLEPGNPGIRGTVLGGGVRFLALQGVAAGRSQQSDISCSVSWDPSAGSGKFLRAYAVSPSRPYLVPGKHLGKATVALEGGSPNPGTWLIAVLAPPGASQAFTAKCSNQVPYLVDHREGHVLLPSKHQPRTFTFDANGGSEVVVLALKEPDQGSVQVTLVHSGGAVADQVPEWDASDEASAFRLDVGQGGGPYRVVFLSQSAQRVDTYVVSPDGNVGELEGPS